ncbi:type II toxin-antitoxin system HicB family antitoxin [Chitinibacter sp. GC72]|uniref:type II toxin-antitoxin system HicB family antitoxin n=1 Tax=Chitinibacter sp. GC72 TaxID=1526917 RepID=UPI0012FB1B6C|nr:type II toxin-antitoxin system HicB family antitoxin [Chitinibacter sp. GC72]
MKYPIAIHKDPDSSYGVTVPDVPGCFSGGDTLDEAMDSAKEAILLHLSTLLQENMPMPALPADIETHQQNPDFAGAIWAVVDIDMSKLDAQVERVNITMPRWVLATIDQNVGKGKRSAFLVESALKALSRTA